MRYAGSRLEDFLSQGTDFGQVAQEAGAIRNRDAVDGIRRQGEAVGRGIGAAGDIARTEYEAQAGVVGAQSQANADIMSTIGGVVSSGISAIPKLGSGFTTGKASNRISDPTSTFNSLSGPGGALEGGVYDYWAS